MRPKNMKYQIHGHIMSKADDVLGIGRPINYPACQSSSSEDYGTL
jgi:hypothetical protein